MPCACRPAVGVDDRTVGPDQAVAAPHRLGIELAEFAGELRDEFGDGHAARGADVETAVGGGDRQPDERPDRGRGVVGDGHGVLLDCWRWRWRGVGVGRGGTAGRGRVGGGHEAACRRTSMTSTAISAAGRANTTQKPSAASAMRDSRSDRQPVVEHEGDPDDDQGEQGRRPRPDRTAAVSPGLAEQAVAGQEGEHRGGGAQHPLAGRGCARCGPRARRPPTNRTPSASPRPARDAPRRVDEHHERVAEVTEQADSATVPRGTMPMARRVISSTVA